jgi:hypothetical protein
MYQRKSGGFQAKTSRFVVKQVVGNGAKTVGYVELDLAVLCTAANGMLHSTKQ